MQIPLTIVDVIVLGILMISGLIAAYRGFLKETLSVSSWLIAALAAVFFWPITKPFARAMVNPDFVADILALIGVFFLLLIPISFVSFRLSEMVRGSRVGPLDRSLGFVFGLARGLVVVGLAYVVFSSFAPAQAHPAWMTKARLLPVVKGTADVILSLSGKPSKSGKLAKTETDSDASNDTAAPPPKQKKPTADNSKKQDDDAKPAAKPTPEPANDNKEGGGDKQKSYSAKDRRALDQLVNTKSKPK